MYFNIIQQRSGADPGFQVRGGALKKNCAERRETLKFFGVFRVDPPLKIVLPYISFLVVIQMVHVYWTEVTQQIIHTHVTLQLTPTP